MQAPQTATNTAYQTFSKIAQERTYICVALMVILAASTVFWVLIDYSFAFLQLPAFISTIILLRSPRLLKSLLPEQYIGLTGLLVSSLKSICMISYIIYYMVKFFGEPVTTISLDTLGKLHLRPYSAGDLFPQLISEEVRSVSKLFGILLVVLFSLVTVCEILSVYVTYYVFRNTYRLVKIIKETDFSAITRRSRPASFPVSEQIESEDVIELPRVGFVRQDSAYNQLISSATDEQMEIEQGRQNI